MSCSIGSSYLVFVLPHVLVWGRVVRGTLAAHFVGLCPSSSRLFTPWGTTPLVACSRVPSPEFEVSGEMSQDTHYTVVLHLRYSVMWCLRYGVIVCVLCV